MTLRTKLPAVAATVAIMTVAAPSAHAVPTQVGSCGGQVLLVRSTPALTDQTQTGVKQVGNLVRDQGTRQLITGACNDVARTNDAHITQPVGQLIPETAHLSLLGNASCSSTSDAQGADSNVADQWSLTGRLYFEMNQIYTDPTFHTAHEYRIETDISVVGGDPQQLDVMNISGIVLTGASTVPSLSPGATVSGSLWEDPVSLTHGHTGYNTGYELDLNAAAGCADGVPDNASITSMLVGGGDTSASSLLGSTASGLTFSEGQ